MTTSSVESFKIVIERDEGSEAERDEPVAAREDRGNEVESQLIGRQRQRLQRGALGSRGGRGGYNRRDVGSEVGVLEDVPPRP